MKNLDQFKQSESKSFRKLNPHIFGSWNEAVQKIQDVGINEEAAIPNAKPQSKKRIRQSDKPVLNKTESEFQRILLLSNPEAVAQSVRFKLSTGCHYTPDFFSFSQMTAWEVKGRHAWEDSLIKLRMAAKVWPNIRWMLVWKDDGQWQEQHVLP